MFPPSYLASAPAVRRAPQVLRALIGARQTLCTNRAATSSASSPNSTTAAATATKEKRTLGGDLKELRKRGELAVCLDTSLLSAKDAPVFPRIKTTSLSTKQVVITDECKHASVTLVLLAFRRYADPQIDSWRQPFLDALQSTTGAINNRSEVGQIYEVTVNESFATQALSGFTQGFQRRFVDSKLHDFHVAFNDSIREPIEQILPLHNRLYGYAMLLDSKARVRFRAAGYADERAIKVFQDAVKKLVTQDAQK